MMQQKQ